MSPHIAEQRDPATVGSEYFGGIAFEVQVRGEASSARYFEPIRNYADPCYHHMC